MENLSKTSNWKRFIFNFGFEYKLNWTKLGFSTPIVNKIVFEKTKHILGGQVKLVISGGAPLTIKTHEVIKTCLCTELIQGYGLTETTGSATVTDGKVPINNISVLNISTLVIL